MKLFGDFDVLLPAQDVSPEKWAVVACDQFTSQPDYWQKLDDFVGDAPSALRVIYPEVYLADRPKERIAAINATMQKYLDNGVFRKLSDAMVLVERDTAGVKGRLGLIMSVDLEQFDFRPFAKAPIRATEGTVLERIPPRLKIRANAPLEFPHIMLLIDDASRTVIEPLYAARDKLEKLYDFELNMGGGHVRGYAVRDVQGEQKRLLDLLDERVQCEKYGKNAGFLFAVGDGNHSLVTAKRHWEAVREGLSEEERENHPARFALVEVENLHSDSLVFEPIHRVLFGKTDGVLDELAAVCGGTGSVKAESVAGEREISVSSSSIEAIAQIQKYLDERLKRNDGLEVDYVHGAEYTRQVARNLGGIALLMPTVQKNELFPFVLERGVMPKKSFSMGEAEEKRYYLEGKKII